MHWSRSCLYASHLETSSRLLEGDEGKFSLWFHGTGSRCPFNVISAAGRSCVPFSGTHFGCRKTAPPQTMEFQKVCAKVAPYFGLNFRSAIAIQNHDLVCRLSRQASIKPRFPTAGLHALTTSLIALLWWRPFAEAFADLCLH